MHNKSIVLSVVLPVMGSVVRAEDNRASFLDSSDYAYLNCYQFYQCDSLRMQNVFGVTVGKFLGKSRFAYEFQRDLIPFVRFRGRRNTERVASTALILSLQLAVTALTMKAAGASDNQLDHVVELEMIPYGSHIGFSPIRQIMFYLGAIPDVILFTEDNGLLLRVHGGVRIIPTRALSLNIGIEKAGLFAFKHAGGNFPIGISLGVSFAPTGD